MGSDERECRPCAAATKMKLNLLKNDDLMNETGHEMVKERAKKATYIRYDSRFPLSVCAALVAPVCRDERATPL
jgi:hypothetical protein